MRNVCLRILTLALGLFAFVGASNHLHGQQYVELIKFTNTWRYNQSGANLGSATAAGGWATLNYDDTQGGWAGGPALFGLETGLGPVYNEATFSPGVIPTPLSLTSGGGSNGVTITYYFRTKFTNTLASMNGVEIWATNLVDDGCVIYLNGARVGDVRLTNANPSFITLANGGPAVDPGGQYDPVSIVPATRVIPGQNIMAVEVHQSSTNSSDVTFAMKLVAIVSTPLTITSQPQNTTAIVGDNTSLTIGVSGGPVSYRWYRTGNSAVLSTSNSLPFVNVQTNLSGNSYYCVITNMLTPPTTSSIVTLTVKQDLFGPEPLSAVVLEVSATNNIQVTFDEGLLNTGDQRNTNNNFRLLLAGTTNQFVAVTNVQITGVLAILRVATSNWVIGGNYYLLLNNIADTRGNMIAPNTVIGISWNYTVPMTQMSDMWNYYDCGDPFCDPNAAAVYANQAWVQTNYVPTLYWGIGPGILVKESGIPSILCAGDTIGTTISYQLLPTLFRRTFQLDSSYGTSGTLRLRYIVDDGMVLFLNGREIHRYNAGNPGSPVTSSSVAATVIDGATCITNVSVNVSNLVAGTNVLAAAVLQGGDGGGDTVFGLEMDGTFRRTSPAPTTPTNQLVGNKLGNLRLTVTTNGLPPNVSRFSWPVSITATTGFYGFNLMWSSNGDAGLTFPNFNQVTNQSNPYFYTNNKAVGGARIFRLGKPTP